MVGIGWASVSVLLLVPSLPHPLSPVARSCSKRKPMTAGCAFRQSKFFNKGAQPPVIGLLFEQLRIQESKNGFVWCRRSPILMRGGAPNGVPLPGPCRLRHHRHSRRRHHFRDPALAHACSGRPRSSPSEMVSESYEAIEGDKELPVHGRA